jgi:hydroxymethylpyrimidine pyrophosphatase-like HAD family hydrolase
MTRVLFASDLDRTLIYPLRTLPMGHTATVIEHHHGRGVTVASDETLKALRELAARNAFVPVTTRSRMQLERVSPVWQLAVQGWAICSDGATLLHQGAVDPDWNGRVDDICATSAPLAEGLEVFKREVGSPETAPWVATLYDCDRRFLYARIVDAEKPDGLEQHAQKAFAPLGWKAIRHGAKLYAMPAGLGKAAAVRYLCERLRVDTLLAAGDSVLDIEVMEDADVAWCPSDAELVALAQVPYGALITTREHVGSAQQIAQAALERVRDADPAPAVAAAPRSRPPAVSAARRSPQPAPGWKTSRASVDPG